jgi:hypothetical protein
MATKVKQRGKILLNADNKSLLNHSPISSSSSLMFRK